LKNNCFKLAKNFSLKKGSMEFPPVTQLFIKDLLKRAGGVTQNSQRDSYAPWLKQTIGSLLQKEGVSYDYVFLLTGIPIKTLENFKQDAEKLFPEKQDVDPSAMIIANAWLKAPPQTRATLDSFWLHLGSNYQTLDISFDRVRRILIELGLRNPRGPSIKNNGTQTKKELPVNALWDGDGKLLRVSLNGEVFESCWYAYIDQGSTLLTGSSITNNESAESITSALDRGKDKAGFYPVGILLDNRMTMFERSKVVEFCKKKDIVLINTFPGNSKSNGHIEGNFSIFERFVGPINITGSNPEEISRSIMEMIVEIFTQMRNHKKRKRFGNRSPIEIAEGSTRPEVVRSALEKLRDRLAIDQTTLDDKFKLIESLIPKFGTLSESSLKKIKSLLSIFSAQEIIAACAAYMAQSAKHPDKHYQSEYFFGILRHKREGNAKLAYNEEFLAKHNLHQELLNQKINPNISAEAVQRSSEVLVANIGEYLKDVVAERIPARRLLFLDSLVLWIAQNSVKIDIQKLWEKLTNHIQKSIFFTQRSWATINEYIYNKLGNLMLNKKDLFSESG